MHQNVEPAERRVDLGEGALDRDGQPFERGNRGRSVEIMAPGVEIVKWPLRPVLPAEQTTRMPWAQAFSTAWVSGSVRNDSITGWPSERLMMRMR